MSLSSLIVQREIASIREVEEALARQVLYGGDLVTNLLEVSKVEESALVPILAESFGLPPAPAGELPAATTDAKKLVAPEVALERGLAPMSVDRNGLVIAVAEPLPHDVAEELRFALALPITQRIAPLVRIRQALSRDYGMPLERRHQRLLLRLLGDRSHSSYPAMRPPPEVYAPPRPPSVVPVALRPDEPPPRRTERIPRTLVRDGEAPPLRPMRRRRGPLSVETARSELEEAGDRDTIFDIVFELARQYFDYTMLFVVKDEVAEARDASGEGASRTDAVRIAVPLDVPSVLARARDAKAMLRGAPSSEIDVVLAQDIGRPVKTEWIVMPILVRARVVALLLCDAGGGDMDEGSLSDVRSIAGASIAAFERLLVRRKLLGSAPPPGVVTSSRPPPGSSVPPTQASMQPAIEELAPPIRDLMNEPLSAVAPTPRDPSVPPRPKALTEQPPPPNLLTPRRPSGPPIPREEPDGAVAPRITSEPVRKPSGQFQRAQAPVLDFGARPAQSSLLGGDSFAPDEIERRLISEIHGRPEAAPATTRDIPFRSSPPASPKAESPPPMRAASRTDVSPGTLPMFAAPRLVVAESDSLPPPPVADYGRTVRAPEVAPVFAPDSKPMPPSEQQVSVAPHRPPSSHNDSSGVLPSVIVDIASEYVTLVDRVLEAPDEDAETHLLRAGGYAMPAIMAKFPGPITIARELLADGRLPRVAECGPILRLVASQRRTALPSVLAHVEDADAEGRFWATYLLTELVYPDAVGPAVERVFDEEPRVRMAARAAVRAMAEAHPSATVERLATVAADPAEDVVRRSRAIAALAETREPLAVEVVLPLLEDPAIEVSSACRVALVTLARQDFGKDAAKWRAWWDQNQEKHHIEWLIDALALDDAQLRSAAFDELVTITKEQYGYTPELPKKDRERIQGRYREWWTSLGRVLFSRASTRGS